MFQLVKILVLQQHLSVQTLLTIVGVSTDLMFLADHALCNSTLTHYFHHIVFDKDKCSFCCFFFH